MKYLTGNEIRQKYLDFFAERGHLVLPSASLIPHDDPTLLLIGAGMAPFKPFFTGKMKPPSPGDYHLREMRAYGSILKTSAIRPAIIRILKCWATFPSGITSRRKSFPGPGNF